jgi:HAD superfamily hydrolase (TIGR01549 family)
MPHLLASAPRALLLERGWPIEPEALGRALPAANHSYVTTLSQGGAHEDGWAEFMRAWLRAAGLDAEVALCATVELRREHDRFNLWRQVPAGVPEAIAALRRAGIPVGLVSNSEGQLQALLERVGLGQAFDLVMDSTVEGVSKPAPEIFHRACERLGVDRAETLYAGDIPEIDVRGALRAGLQAALVDPYGLYPDFAEAPRFASLTALARAILAPADSRARGGEARERSRTSTSSPPRS